MPPSNISQTKPNLLKKHRVKIVITLVALCLLWFISQYSFVQIDVTNTSGETSFKLTNDNREITGSTTTQTTKKLINKGSYQLTVNSGDRSYFQKVSTPGFFQTTKINAKLMGESARYFIGKSPGTCLYHQQDTSLISWQCGGTLQSAKLHVPQINKTSAYNDSLANDVEHINIQGVVQISGKSYVFTQIFDEHSSQHGLYPIDKNGSIDQVNFREIGGLNPEKKYGITQYKQGVLVYGLDGSDFQYFNNLESPSEKINITQPNLKEISFYGVAVAGNSIIVLNNKHYNQEQQGQLFINPSTSVLSKKYLESSDEGTRNENTPINYSEVVVFENNMEKKYKLDFPASQARICGESFLCVVGDEKLKIYKISGSELDLIEQIDNVKQIEGNNKEFYVVTSKGILNYDTSKLTGYYLYTFGDYTYCGFLKSYNSNYKPMVCVSKNGKSSLLEFSTGTNDNIDKKISGLNNQMEVQSSSVYKNNILIVPKINNMIFNRNLSSYTYDPQEVVNKKTKILDYLKSVGIDSSRYEINFTTD